MPLRRVRPRLADRRRSLRRCRDPRRRDGAGGPRAGGHRRVRRSRTGVPGDHQPGGHVRRRDRAVLPRGRAAGRRRVLPVPPDGAVHRRRLALSDLRSRARRRSRTARRRRRAVHGGRARRGGARPARRRQPRDPRTHGRRPTTRTSTSTCAAVEGDPHARCSRRSPRICRDVRHRSSRSRSDPGASRRALPDLGGVGQRTSTGRTERARVCSRSAKPRRLGVARRQPTGVSNSLLEGAVLGARKPGAPPPHSSSNPRERLPRAVDACADASHDSDHRSCCTTTCSTRSRA